MNCMIGNDTEALRGEHSRLILDCTPNDLIEVEVVNAEVRKTGGQAPAVRRTSIRRPEGL
jgi:hypothetical protein